MGYDWQENHQLSINGSATFQGPHVWVSVILKETSTFGMTTIYKKSAAGPILAKCGGPGGPWPGLSRSGAT